MTYIEKMLAEFDEKFTEVSCECGARDLFDFSAVRAFLTTKINQALAEDRERVREGLGEMRKEVVVTKRITRNLGQGNYSTLEDGGDILIRNPKMTENEQEQGIGYNQALDDLLYSLQSKPLTDKE